MGTDSSYSCRWYFFINVPFADESASGEAVALRFSCVALPQRDVSERLNIKIRDLL
jgi:hypothetical protein